MVLMIGRATERVLNGRVLKAVIAGRHTTQTLLSAYISGRRSC